MEYTLWVRENIDPPGYLFNFGWDEPNYLPIIFSGRAADLAALWRPRYTPPGRKGQIKVSTAHDSQEYDTCGLLADLITDEPHLVSGPGAAHLPAVIGYLRSVFLTRKKFDPTLTTNRPSSTGVGHRTG